MTQLNPSGETLSIVMVTLNEEQSVVKVVSEIQSIVPQAEIVIVDSSRDKTAEIANQLGCIVVKQIPAVGYGPALHAGFQKASRQVVITLDCDETYPANAIPKLLSKMDEGYDLVSASRLIDRPKAMPLANYLANQVFNFLAYVICGVKSSDLHTGMRAYRAQLLEDFAYDPHGMALPVELQIGPSRQGFACIEIAIEYKERAGASKLNRLQGTIWTLKRIWKWRRIWKRR